ncbi:FtsQ-type POTRA domain-containing protein [Microbacterium sp. gxy059]|uniref:FtsQ-type POTRA domain-containing protein n=1 Tax=Microbacterium sp. gxy059 TaxID=2957199 RepID=UPI003D9977B8
MKRPGPLPPRERSSAPADEEADAPSGALEEETPRRRPTDLLSFVRRGRGADSGEGSGEDPLEDDDAGDVPDSRWSSDGGRLRRWREHRRQSSLERREVRRFTARSRRRRRAWIGAGAAFLIVGAGSVGAAYSPLFAVESIEVVGAETISPEAISSALDAQRGRPLPLVDHSEIKAELVGFPLIETYQVEARPPHELVVRIVERTPVAVIESDAGFTTVDAAGVALATDPERPEGLPIADAEGGPGSAAFAAAGQVLRSLPDDVLSRVTSVSASSPEDIALFLSDGGGVRVVWGSSEDTARKLETLKSGMKANPPEEVSVYDVSSAGVLVVG